MRWGAIRDLIRYRVQVFNKNSDGYKNVLFIRVFWNTPFKTNTCLVFNNVFQVDSLLNR